MDGWTDGWTDGRMDGRMDGRTDGRTAYLKFTGPVFHQNVKASSHHYHSQITALAKNPRTNPLQSSVTHQQFAAILIPSPPTLANFSPSSQSALPYDGPYPPSV